MELPSADPEEGALMISDVPYLLAVLLCCAAAVQPGALSRSIRRARGPYLLWHRLATFCRSIREAGDSTLEQLARIEQTQRVEDLLDALLQLPPPRPQLAREPLPLQHAHPVFPRDR